MSDHLVLCADRLIASEKLQSPQDSKAAPSLEQTSSPQNGEQNTGHIDIDEKGKQGLSEEEEPLINAVECRICQDEDSVKNLESPCACIGSLKYAHRKCVQRWCNEKGDTICEICNQPYQPGYTAPQPASQSEDTVIDVSEVWTVGGTPLDLDEARVLAMAAAERQILEAEYDEYADTTSGTSFCRSAALILIGLLLLRHALSLSDGNDEDDDSTFFTLFLLRAAGFLLPCYIMAWAISILQRRRQRQLLNQEAAALTASEVAFMLQSGEHRGLQVAIAPGSVDSPQQDALH